MDAAHLAATALRVAMLTAALWVTGIGTARAACTDADLCPLSECRDRQSRVHPACDQKRSCRDVDPDQRAELHRRLQLNEQCLAERRHTAACFSQTDAGHAQQIRDVERAAARCRDKLDGSAEQTRQ